MNKTYEMALNLQPGDEIEWMPDEWWIVVACSYNVNATFPVTIELRSISDANFFSSFACGIDFQVSCRRACGH